MRGCGQGDDGCAVPLFAAGSSATRSYLDAKSGRLAMRVIAGRAGGVRLEVPKRGVRPTMDRVKAAIF